jgi:hypothetical protein
VAKEEDTAVGLFGLLLLSLSSPSRVLTFSCSRWRIVLSDLLNAVGLREVVMASREEDAWQGGALLVSAKGGDDDNVVSEQYVCSYQSKPRSMLHDNPRV